MDPTSVTAGSGPIRYSLYLPFSFGAIHQLRHFSNDRGGCLAFRLLGKKAQVQVERRRAILQLWDFLTEDEALNAYHTIANGFDRAIAGGRASVWLAELGTIERTPNSLRDALAATYKLWEARLPEADGSVRPLTDGAIWPMFSYVLPEHERIMMPGLGFAEEVRFVDPQVLNEWIDAALPKEPPSAKDHLALSLVAQGNGQHVKELEFLSLVRALEVVKKDVKLSSKAKDLQNRMYEIANADIKDAQSKENLDLAGEMEGVRDRLKYGSISDALRELAAQTDPLEIGNATGLGMTRVDNLHEHITEIYSVRSDLVHRGQVKPKQEKDGRQRLLDALPILRYLVHCVFTGRLKA